MVREEKPDVHGGCSKVGVAETEVEKSVRKLKLGKKSHFTLGIEPGTAVSISKHTTPTPPSEG